MCRSPRSASVLALTESRLGYPLFERARGKLLPTPEARRLHAEVEQVYGGVRRVNALATALRREGAGTLRVVASAAFAQQLVPRALAHLRAGGVPTRIDYRSVTFDELVGCFLSGRADVGVSMVPAGHASVASTRLGRQPLVCILPQDHPLAGRAVLTPEDFAGTAWIGYPQGTPLGRAVARFFGERAVHCAPAIEVHSSVTACAFVQQGLGPALVDAWSVTPAMRPALAVRTVSPEVGLEIWATHSSLVPLPLAGRRFLTSVGEVLRDAAPHDACAQG
ncbi:LysR substrate-binding domain-containing protein [Cupriavidus sp. DF5525]|uniref:LysR substrate-binding domain-containing protein n=1 Tax=Cupriavidus sp. DF5525 TaxID=3160989 RepID=UPI0032DEFCF8